MQYTHWFQLTKKAERIGRAAEVVDELYQEKLKVQET